MFSRSQLLFKRLILRHPSKTKIPFKTGSPPFNHYLQCFSNKNFMACFKIPMHSFASSPQNLTQADYQEDVALLQVKSDEQLSGLRQALDFYATCEDYRSMHPADIAFISTILFNLANALRAQGDLDKAFRYLEEDENLHKRTGIRDTFELAQNYFVRSTLYLEQSNWTDAKYYLNEVDRICKLLGEDPSAKSLIIQSWVSLLNYYRQSDPDRSLSLCYSVLERVDDVEEQVLPRLLNNVYRVMGHVYESKQDAEKAMEYWTKGLEAAIESFGENSNNAFFFSKHIADFLYDQDQVQKALPYAKKSLEIALNVFSKDSEEVALSYKLLADIYIAQHDYANALIPSQKAAKFYEASSLPNSLHEIYFHLVRIYCSQGDFKQASSFFAKANQALMTTSGLNGEIVAKIYAGWAQRMENFESMIEETEIYYLKAVDVLKNLRPFNKALIKAIYGSLGKLVWSQRDWNKALEFSQECEKYTEKTDSDALRSINMYQGSILMNLGKFDEAEKCYQLVVQNHKAEEGDELDAARGANQVLGAIYEGRGMLKEALDFYKKARNFLEQSENKHELGIQELIEKISEIENRLK